VATPREQRRFKARGAVLLLLCGAAVATPSAREYRTIEVESLRVTIDSDWAPRAAPGYLPVRFDITNLADARVIEIVGEGSRAFRSPGAGQGATSVRQTVRLARGDRVRLTIPVPIFADSESIRFELREDNRTLERFGFSGFQSRVAPANASVLIVADSGSAFGATIAASLPRRSGRGSVGGIVTSPSGSATVTTTVLRGSTIGSAGAPPMDVVLEPARLPANWLGYTSLRTVMIGPGEWGQLSDPQKNAILTWIACGGDLIFVDGDLGVLLPGVQGEAAADPDRVVRRHFLGRIHVVPSAPLATAGLAPILVALDKTRDIDWALPINSGRDWGVMEGRGFKLRIPGVDGVPARVYLGILILFSALIGPVNYWLLWRKRRQVLLVLTAPLISAVFIVLLAGYAIAGEGLRVHGRVLTFTMLDQGRKQAATRASVSVYAAGLTPSGGLRFARDVAVYPIGTEGTGTRERLTLDLTDAQRFSAGLLQARAPSNFEQVAFRPARERLTFSRGADGVSVTNGLEATVTGLLYRDGDTLYTLDGSLPPGAKHVLSGGSIDPLQVLSSVALMGEAFERLLQNQPRGSYLAVLDRSPFWEPGVSSLIERGSLHLVLGWPDGQQ
jgi:hypothetical protein